MLRADFVDKNEANQTVVPMTDVAYLPPGGQTVLDPLANDTDPDGQGLAVREVDVDPNAPITAAVVDLHLVQVSAPRTPRGTVVLRVLGVRRRRHQGGADPDRPGAGTEADPAAAGRADHRDRPRR